MLEDPNILKPYGEVNFLGIRQNTKNHTIKYNIDIEVSYCRMCQYIKIKKFSVS